MNGSAIDIAEQALLLDPHYERWGVAARIILRSGEFVDVVAIDETDGISISDDGGRFQLETIRPVVSVRSVELAARNLTTGDIVDGQVVLGRGTAAEKTWRIKLPRLSGGETQLILLEEKP